MSKSKDEVAVSDILQYLIKQNRPYSVIDIFNNLHKEHGKTVVARALDQLVSDDRVKEKTYGKQKVYFVNQSEFPEGSENDLQTMDAEISDLNELFTELQQEIKEKENVLRSLENSMTTKEAESQLSITKKEIPRLTQKLATLESNKTLLKPEEQKFLHSSREKYCKEWQKRKRIGRDMLDAILENYPKSKDELCEEIGVETDEYFNMST